MAKEVVFYNGKRMPVLGLGTLLASDEEMITAVDTALEAGYRHIDTAYYYKNEAAIGKVLKKWLKSGKIKREDLFIVTKLPENRADSVEKYLKLSLQALQLDYVDLYLIHHPCGLTHLLEAENKAKPEKCKGPCMGSMFKKAQTPVTGPNSDHVTLWKAMEAQVDAGRARSIGLSNFNSIQIARVVKAARIKPANLQVELNIYFQQRELVAFCKALDITVCAYSPFASPGLKVLFAPPGFESPLLQLNPLTDPVVVRIGQAHGKTPAQVLLRHSIQRGIVVIPKSTNPARIKDNFKVFDFELTKEEVDELDDLDQGSQARLFNADAMKEIADHPDFPFNEPY